MADHDWTKPPPFVPLVTNARGEGGGTHVLAATILPLLHVLSYSEFFKKDRIPVIPIVRQRMREGR